MRSFVTSDAPVEVVSAGADSAASPEVNEFAYSVKGVMDRLVAFMLLAVLAIPMTIIAVLIKMASPGPVFVRQTRVGRFGRPFTAYKFRSMREDAELLRDELEHKNSHAGPKIFKMKEDPRVNRLGRFIRRTSIDEIPQLINVARGEMSLVGPRPPLPREVMHYEPHHLQRLAVTPGMTGLWQVRGRSEIPFEEMVELDLEYIRNWSLWSDVCILAKTPLAVLGGRGAW